MITIKLQGGLGNQMFQYAFGRKAADDFKTDLKLDLSWFGHEAHVDTPRQYRLNNFNIRATEIILKEKNIAGLIFDRIARKIRNEFNLGTKIKDGAVLGGWWQSEKYFRDIGNEIKKDFTLKNPLGKAAAELMRKISNDKDSISIHMRRGDYVENEETKKYHGALPASYYDKAIGIIRDRIKSPSFFIFSDDIEWVKKNLFTSFPTEYVSGSSVEDYEELILMSHCKNNIIANSSFSWWGAWLNDNPGKIVIAPEKWSNNPPRTYRDVVPDSWMKI